MKYRCALAYGGGHCAMAPPQTLKIKKCINSIRQCILSVYTKMLNFRRITLFCLEKCLSKHKMTIFSKNLATDMTPWPPNGNFLRTPLPVCDVIIVSTISRMLRPLLSKFHVTHWWSWARLCCVWKLWNIARRPVSALKTQQREVTEKPGLRDVK